MLDPAARLRAISVPSAGVGPRDALFVGETGPAAKVVIIIWEVKTHDVRARPIHAILDRTGQCDAAREQYYKS